MCIIDDYISTHDNQFGFKKRHLTDMCIIDDYISTHDNQFGFKKRHLTDMCIIDDYISTHDNQFGFKKRHSTDMCIIALKYTIEYYIFHNSMVYSCYLDASNAYDKVNHRTLFKKLIDQNVTLLIVVRILMFWYRNQTFIVKCDTLSSSAFAVSNGVYQGAFVADLDSRRIVRD